MSSLNDKVYEFVKSIPRGKVATYGQIALHLGNKNFARAVGTILHNNPDPEHIPCIQEERAVDSTSENIFIMAS